MGLAQRTVLDDDGQPIETPEETALAAELTADPPTVRAEADAFLLIAESFVAANGPTGERGDGLEVVPHAELVALIATQPTDTESTQTASTGSEQTVAGQTEAEQNAATSTTGRAAVRSPSGQPLLPTTALRRLCEMSVRVFLCDSDGRPLDLGRRRRHASPKQRRALQIRDQGCCRHPGSTQRKRLIPHHVDWWSRGGPTDLDNLILFCPSHHRAVHEVGYTVVALGDGRFRFTAPDGREIVEHPDRQPVAPPTATAPCKAPAPTWGGEHLDLAHLIDGMAANHLIGSGARLPDIPVAELHQTLRDAVGWPVAAPGAASDAAA